MNVVARFMESPCAALYFEVYAVGGQATSPPPPGMPEVTITNTPRPSPCPDPYLSPAFPLAAGTWTVYVRAVNDAGEAWSNPITRAVP